MKKGPTMWLKVLKSFAGLGKFPFAASWCVTDECHRHCAYCGHQSKAAGELLTGEALDLVDQLAEMGVVFLALTGGEPLLRPDLGTIVERAKSLGLRLSINTAAAKREHLGLFRNASHVALSLDGPRAVNDRIRGEGAFDETMEAMQLLLGAGIRVSLTTVISRLNHGNAAELVSIAKAAGVPISFQPATQNRLGGTGENPIAPVSEMLQKDIDTLIRLEKRPNSPILNSAAGLRHLAKWPGPTQIRCVAGKFIFRISSEGLIYPCDWGRPIETQPVFDIRKHALSSLSGKLKVEPCGHCWCSRMVELNLLSGFHPATVLSHLKKGF